MIRKADTDLESSANGVAVSVPLALIDPHPQQPRQRFDDAELQALAESMKVDELLQRPIVRAMPNGRYQLVAGERRCRAAKLAGWHNMPVIVRELSDMESLKLLGTENLLRKDWGQMEVARYLGTLTTPLESGGVGFTHEQAAAMFGKTYAWVSEHTRALKLPTVWHERIEAEEIGIGHVCALLPHIDKRRVMQAIDADYQKNPWAWLSAKDFKRNVEFLVKAPARQKRPRVRGDVPRKATTKPFLEGDKLTAAAAKKLAEVQREDIAKTLATKQPRLINKHRICKILKPFIHDCEMLVAIRDTCNQLINDLHAGKEAGEAVTV